VRPSQPAQEKHAQKEQNNESFVLVLRTGCRVARFGLNGRRFGFWFARLCRIVAMTGDQGDGAERRDPITRLIVPLRAIAIERE